MLRVGLTGGIASGKSVVAEILRDNDCQVLEMDPLGHEMLEPGQPAYGEVVAEFGKEILEPSGKVDRRKLGAIVFADPAKRARLNQILHPRILEVVQSWFAALDRPGGPEIAFAEAALIVESGFHKNLNRLVVCWCRPEQQLERLQERALSPEQARQRIAAQMPIDEKRGYADIVIDCSGTLANTETQVGTLLEKLAQWAGEGSGGELPPQPAF
jgi:dephospho-CoA kinase